MMLDEDEGANNETKYQHGETSLHSAIENKIIDVNKLLLKYRDNDGISLLHLATGGTCLQIVEHLLKHGADTNCLCISTWRNSYAPLHLAVGRGPEELITLVLSGGANVDAKVTGSITPLQIASKKECNLIAENHLNHGACTHSSTLNECYTPPHLASEIANEETVKLLNRGADSNASTKDNLTPLHIASKKECNLIAEDYLNHGARTHSSTLNKGYTPLHLASELANEETVKLLLNRGADSNAITKDNLTPLHIATKRGRKTVVKLLLQHGAKVDNQDKDGKTILHLAVEEGYLPIVEDVLKYCPDINNQSNRNCLYIAVYGNEKVYKDIVEALLEYGLIVYPEDANNPKLLHAAVEKGYLKIIEDLLKYGADVNTLYYSNCIRRGFTPLHSAAKNKQEEAAKLLISYGADINAQDKTGKAAIFYAIENADFKITKLLLTNRANIKDSPELLNIAVKKECIEIVEALLEYDANVNSRLSDITPLHDAAHIRNKGITIMLLNKGANVNAKQKDGTTALHIATRNGDKEVVKLLLECGAQVDSKMKNDMTPLHLGAEKGYLEIIKTILNFGADINSRDKYGRTALHIACQKGRIRVVTALLMYGSDINIMNINNHTPLDRAIIEVKKFYNSQHNEDDFAEVEAIAELLKIHIVIMKTANLYVSEKNLLSVSNSYDLRGFQYECEEEITRMKSKEINKSNISFYDVLVKDTSLLATYLKNENIVQILKSDDHKRQFPIYASMIKNSFRKGMERKKLLEQGDTFSTFLCNSFPELPYDCIETILSYLSIKDLRILIDACKPLVHITPQ